MHINAGWNFHYGSRAIGHDRRWILVPRGTGNELNFRSLSPSPHLGKAVVSGLRVDNNRSEITGVRTRNDRD